MLLFYYILELRHDINLKQQLKTLMVCRRRIENVGACITWLLFFNRKGRLGPGFNEFGYGAPHVLF